MSTSCCVLPSEIGLAAVVPGESIPESLFHFVWRRVHADENTDVEVNGEGEQRLYVPAVL